MKTTSSDPGRSGRLHADNFPNSRKVYDEHTVGRARAARSSFFVPMREVSLVRAARAAGPVSTTPKRSARATTSSAGLPKLRVSCQVARPRRSVRRVV